MAGRIRAADRPQIAELESKSCVHRAGLRLSKSGGTCGRSSSCRRLLAVGLSLASLPAFALSPALSGVLSGFRADVVAVAVLLVGAYFALLFFIHARKVAEREKRELEKERKADEKWEARQKKLAEFRAEERARIREEKKALAAGVAGEVVGADEYDDYPEANDPDYVFDCPECGHEVIGGRCAWCDEFLYSGNDHYSES